MNNKQEYKLNLFKPSGEYMGELDVNNLALFLTREGFSNITFDIAAKIDNKTNKRLYDIYDQYEVELILRNKTYRFIITDTPANMNDDGSLTYSYTAISTDFELTKKHIFHWEGIKKYTYWRRVDYKAADGPFGPQIITPINLQKIDGVFDSQEVEIYEVRKTAEQERESLLVDMTGIELNPNQMGEGTFVIVEENGVAKAKIAPFSDSRKDQIPLITEIYYKIYDKIAFADSDIEYNELLNKYQFDNAEFYSTPTGETKEFDGLLYQEEEYYTTIGVTIKDIVDGTIHKDTEWKVNINEDIAKEKRSDIEINNLNAYQLIETIAKSFDVVFVVDSSNREISFYKKYDDIPNTIQNNLVIDFQTYLKAISKDITTDEVVTNIIASGSDGISTAFISPTGRNWENYDYYLDSYLMFREDGEFLEHNTNIETITDIKELEFTHTKDFTSRWLSHSAAEKLGLWSITKDYYYRLLNNLPQRANTSKITGNDIYRNLAERREKLLKELVLNETKADQYYAQELHYKNLATIVDNEEIFDEEDLKDTDPKTNPIYARYLKQNERSANYLKISNENKLSKERFEKIIQELEYLTMGYHKEIYDSNPPRGTNVYKLMEDLRILFDKENPQWNFTQKELKEIEKIKKDVLWNDDSIDNEVDLFLAANDYLLENNKPKVTIGIDIVDILAAAEVEIDKDNLFLGNYIYVRFEEFNIDTKAQISSLNINFEENTIDMEITTLKHFSKGITHKVIQKINGLSVESKNITEYYKDYNKRSGEESKRLTDIFGDDYNADTNTISGGGTGVDEKGNPVHDIVINGEGIKTSNMKIDAATDNIIIDTDAGTTIQLKNGMLGLVGKGKQGNQEIKTRVMMSTTQGFRIDVMKEDELGYQSVDNKFWADLNGNLTVKGKIYATGGQIGDLTIEDINNIPSKLKGLGKDIELSEGEMLQAVEAEKERAELAERTAQEAAAEADRLAKLAQTAADQGMGDADEAKKAADEAQRVADEAQKAADQGIGSADEAKKAADYAQEAAKEADRLAKLAQTAADEAQKVADQGIEDAKAAADAAKKAQKDLEDSLAGAQIKGEKIAGWTTSKYRFSANSGEGLNVTLDSGTLMENGILSPYRIWAGADEGKDAPFSVQSDGTIKATKAVIEGKIIATSGRIGSLEIEAVEEFQNDISQAKTTASQAATDAATATGTANQAKTAASGAVTAASEAKTAASGAVTAAGEAKTAASGAVTAASGAVTTASGAVTAAGEAKTAASGAVTAASEAKTAASGAVTTAGQAKETADGINTGLTNANIDLSGKKIAGWKLSQFGFESNSTGSNHVALLSDGDWRVLAGGDENTAKFKVHQDGSIYASNAEIEGKVTINNGSIMIGAQTSWFEQSGSSYPERFFYVDSVVIDGLTIYRWLSDDEAHNPNQPQYLLTETRGVGIGDVVWGYQIIDDGHYDKFNYKDGERKQRIIINVSEGQNYNFIVDKNGVMNAKGAVIEGKITSESGNIGGWNIGKTSLTGDSTRVGMGTGSHFLWAGNMSPTQGNFYVSKSGEMTAKRGTIGSFHIGHYENGSWENIPISSSDDALIKKTRFNFGRTIVESQLDGYGFMSKSGLQAARVGPGIISLFTGYSMDMTGPDPGMTSALPYLSAIPTVSLDAEGLTIIEDFTFYASKMPDKPAPKFKVTGYNRSGERYSALMVNYAGISASVASTEFSSKAIKKDISKIDDSQFYNFLEIIDPKKYKLREDDSEGISIIIEDEIEKNLPFKDILFGKKEFNEMIYNDIDSVPDWIREQSKNFDILETLEDGRVVFNPLSYNVNSMIGVLIGTVKNLHNRVKELESKLNI